LFVNTSNNWSELYNGLINGFVNDLMMTGNALYAASYNGVSKSVNNGSLYNSVNNGLTSKKAVVLANKNNNILYTGTSDSGVYRSTNAGATWIHTPLNNLYIYSLTVSGNNVFAGTAFDGIFRSTDNGITWNQTSVNNRRIRSICAKGTIVYAGTSNTHGNPSGNILVSNDNGNTWIEYSIESPGFPVVSIGIFDNDHVIAASTNGIFISTNSGINWSAINSSVKIGVPSKLTVMGYGDVYAATSAGVIGSYDYGKSWESTSYGLLSKNCKTIAGNLNWLFVGPENLGIWKLNLLSSSSFSKIIKENINAPAVYDLKQNYPNPFNPATVIEFSVPREDNVNITIYDNTGKIVKKLIDQNYPPGSYTISLNMADLSSGVYFYTLKSGSFRNTKKMLLIK
jgi:hypothetical protein